MGRQYGVGVGNVALVADDDSVLDLDDAIGPGLEPGVVGHADDGGAVFGGGATKQANDHLSVLAVQGRGRLVGEQDLGILGQGAVKEFLTTGVTPAVGPLQLDLVILKMAIGPVALDVSLLSLLGVLLAYLIARSLF